MGGKTSAASHNKYMAKAYDRVNLILRKDAPQNKAAMHTESMRQLFSSYEIYLLLSWINFP